MEVSGAGVSASASRQGIDLSIQFGVPLLAGAGAAVLGWKYAVKHGKNKWLFAIGGLAAAGVLTYVVTNYVMKDKSADASNDGKKEESSGFGSNVDLNLGDQMTNAEIDLSGADGKCGAKNGRKFIYPPKGIPAYNDPAGFKYFCIDGNKYVVGGSGSPVGKCSGTK